MTKPTTPTDLARSRMTGGDPEPTVTALYKVETDTARSYIIRDPEPWPWDRIDVDRIGRAESLKTARKIARQLNAGTINEYEARRMAAPPHKPPAPHHHQRR